MPDLATTDSAIRIVRWIVQPGEQVQRGQALLEVETDKAAMEVESVVNGVFEEARAEVDEEVSVGQVIAILKTEGPAHAPSSSTKSAPPPAASAVATPPPAAPDRSASGSEGMFARKRATADPAPAAAGIPLSVAQRTAAKRLQECKQIVPHFYLQTRLDASAIIARRQAAQPVKLVWDAFFVRAAGRALDRFERFGCRFEGDRLVPLENNDAVGVAVDIEGELYVVPIAGPADKSLEQISAEIRENVERLRTGDPEVRKTRPARMTVSNLGVCNVESFIPIINPPETVILGVGQVLPTPVVLDDGVLGIRPQCTLTLSVDHRVAAGRYAAEFLDEIVRELTIL
ncbi:MAG: 2-oxo acid dehydrogenase subunit E2 [Pirellulales bacterium]|nr:2-oxo acid dehydrogenase subunit E2 [Pirellulales bacterium]